MPLEGLAQRLLFANILKPSMLASISAFFGFGTSTLASAPKLSYFKSPDAATLDTLPTPGNPLLPDPPFPALQL